tara:strand:- start:143 stop:1234 length:1092 start_codon:yes stop_codon:yes gene_type:complete
MTDQIDYDAVSQQIIDQIIRISFDQFVQKLEVGAEDLATLIVNDLREKSLQAILGTMTFTRQIARDEGFLFPTGTRFLFNRGNAKIVVVEQPPQVRTLILSDSLLFPTEKASLGVNLEGKDASSQWALSLPYVVFIAFIVDKDKADYCQLYVFFNKKPLESLDSKIYKPVFSNTNGDCSVCRASAPWKKKAPVNLKIETLISSFWQSKFNTDLSDHWKNRHEIDQRLLLPTWLTLSVNDPLFVCNVNWHSFTTLGKAMDKVVSQNFEHCGVTADRVHSKFTALITPILEDLNKRLIAYLKQERLERFYPKDVKKDLSHLVQGMCGEMETFIRKLVLELGAARQRINQQGEEINWEKSEDGVWK